MARRWRAALRARLDEIDWEEALRDLRPFVERSDDLQVFDKEMVARRLKGA